MKAIKKSAPSVKRVVITSSFASIIDGAKTTRPGYTYSEKDWNPVTEEEAIQNPSNGYRASKTFAEKAAWGFVEQEKPNFTLATVGSRGPDVIITLMQTQCCPPLVLGPIVHYLNSLDALNTSNQRIRDIMTGACKSELKPTGTFIWVDVRDLALCHVKAAELPEAANKRFFITAGYFSNKEIANIIREAYPKLASNIPTGDALKAGDYPADGIYKYDNSRTVDVLGIKFIPLKQSIIDTVKSLQEVGA